MRYACIHRRRHQHSVRTMSRLLRVSRSGYYDWCQRGESARSQRDRELTQCIRRLHLESNGVYGARKIHRELLDMGELCGRHKVARLMRKVGLKGCPKRRFGQPLRPAIRINRATLCRPHNSPLSSNSRCTLRAPETPRLSRWIPRIHCVSSRSRRALTLSPRWYQS